ncbi:hypothetical protein V8E36_004446 [Tilletia maclaganii]
MPNWWKHQNEDHILWVVTALDQAVSSVCSSFAPNNHSINEALARKALSLPGSGVITETALAQPRCGLVLSPRYLPVRVLVDTASPNEILSHLGAGFPADKRVFVVEAWQISSFSGTKTTFLNEVVALLVVQPPPGGSWADPIATSDLLNIPGFLGPKTGDGCMVLYNGHLNWCWGCKVRASAFHLVNDCTNTAVPCGLCNRRGHTPVDCSKNPNFSRKPDSGWARHGGPPTPPSAPAPPPPPVAGPASAGTQASAATKGSVLSLHAPAPGSLFHAGAPAPRRSASRGRGKGKATAARRSFAEEPAASGSGPTLIQAQLVYSPSRADPGPSTPSKRRKIGSPSP